MIKHFEPFQNKSHILKYKTINNIFIHKNATHLKFSKYSKENVSNFGNKSDFNCYIYRKDCFRKILRNALLEKLTCYVCT